MKPWTRPAATPSPVPHELAQIVNLLAAHVQSPVRETPPSTAEVVSIQDVLLGRITWEEYYAEDEAS